MNTTKLILTAASLLGCLLLGAPANAQATSSFTVQTSGSVTTSSETVNFSGPIEITSTIVTDPLGGPPTAVVSVDARQLVAQGATTGTLFLNSGQAMLTRELLSTDTIQTTFSFFPPGPGGFLKTKTAVVNLTLTYNLTTQALTNATASITTPTFH
ncbi:MAG TPA: hypothetical protein VFE90_02720 [Myxococcales bacterium]|jgi:hypothetical protein|nr:hypothetical protein [Myxococcales bacterium]